MKVVGLLVAGFVIFVIYYIFKQMQFVLTATNLYKKMVRRQDATIKLLIDIRDNTKQFDKLVTVDDKDDNLEEPSAEFAADIDVSEYKNIEAGKLYNIAYAAYEIKDYAKAKIIYNLLLDKFPNSKEVKWAKNNFKLTL